MVNVPILNVNKVVLMNKQSVADVLLMTKI